MKIDINCEHYKPTNKNGQKERCQCAYLNRNFHRDTKMYIQWQKNNEASRAAALAAKKAKKK